MNSKILVLAALLVGSSAAMAQTQLPTIEVRPAPQYSNDHAALSFACGELEKPRPIDVESLLHVNDRDKLPALTESLMTAIAEACSAGASPIVVERSKQGQSVTWHAVEVVEPEVVRY